MEQMLGKTIARRREQLHLTQKQLAEEIGVPEETVNGWENLETNPDLSLLLPLSKALQISVETLLKDDLADFKTCFSSGPVRSVSRVQTVIRLIAAAIEALACVLFWIDFVFELSKEMYSFPVLFSMLAFVFSLLFLWSCRELVQLRNASMWLPSEFWEYERTPRRNGDVVQSGERDKAIRLARWIYVMRAICYGAGFVCYILAITANDAGYARTQAIISGVLFALGILLELGGYALRKRCVDRISART